METKKFVSKPHDYFDAILMSGSVLSLMASARYNAWRAYSILATEKTKSEENRVMYEEWAIQEAGVLRRLSELIDDAMQFIGESNNGCDAADDHNMTDAAFEAMDRALDRQHERK